MAAPPSTSLTELVKRHFPTADVSSAGAEAHGAQLSQAVYPSTSYSDTEKAEIDQWLTTANRFAAEPTPTAPLTSTNATTPTASEDASKHADRLSSLNTHLSSRTTLLGSKPSLADVALYASLAPAIRRWTAEQRTGERDGHHHIVRWADFVQNAPLFGLAASLTAEEKVAINPDDVLFYHKPLDQKEEKERKKREKEKAAAAAAAAGSESKPLVVGQGKPEDGSGAAAAGKSKKEKAKDAVAGLKDKVKAATSGGEAATADAAATATTTATAAGAGFKTEKKEKKEKQAKPQKQAAAAAPLSPSLIDLRVGHILRCVAHPNADSLYVSTIAVGDAPGTENTSVWEEDKTTVVRTVCSGLNGLVPLAEMQDRRIVAVCNLKPVTMRGIKSAAMVLAASPRLAEGEVDNHAGPVELVEVPASAPAGARVVFEGWEDGKVEGTLNPKKKVWETCQVGFTTTTELGVGFERERVEELKGEEGLGKGRPALARLVVLGEGGGACSVKTLTGAVVR